MKPIRLTEEEKTKLFDKFIEQFKNEIDNFSFSSNSSSITIKTNFNSVAKEKVLILFTPEAYLRMNALVHAFTTEIGWYGLVNKISDKVYEIYDVKVCQQYVTGGKVDTDDKETLDFFESLTDDELDHMHYQAHSHVNMSTSASGVDLGNQADVVKNMGKTGFYIFQIWNKKGDISTYLYDLDNNVFYDSKDVEIAIEDPLGTIDDFIDSVSDLVVERKVYPYQGKKETSYYPTQWDGQYTYGDW